MKYRHSILSIVVVVSWFVTVYQFFKLKKTEHAVFNLISIYQLTIVVGILIAIILIMIRVMNNIKLKNSFVYNLFGTLNIIIGCIGMMLFNNTTPSPYIITASLALGLVMYKDIYSRKSSMIDQKTG
jgi:hypothetical protein